MAQLEMPPDRAPRKEAVTYHMPRPSASTSDRAKSMSVATCAVTCALAKVLISRLILPMSQQLDDE